MKVVPKMCDLFYVNTPPPKVSNQCNALMHITLHYIVFPGYIARRKTQDTRRKMQDEMISRIVDKSIREKGDGLQFVGTVIKLGILRVSV